MRARPPPPAHQAVDWATADLGRSRKYDVADDSGFARQRAGDEVMNRRGHAGTTGSAPAYSPRLQRPIRACASNAGVRTTS